MSKSRVFLFLLLAFIAGVALRSFVIVPWFLIVGAVWGSAISAAVGIIRKSSETIIYSFLILAAAAGIFRYDQVENSRPDLSGFYGKPLVLNGIVWDEPDFNEKTQKIKLLVKQIDFQNIKPEFLVLATTRRYPEYKIGDELKIQGLLERPENYSGFDYVSYLGRQNIFSVMRFPIIEKTGEGKGSKLKLTLSKIKNSFEEKMEIVLPEPHAAFLKGLLLGERESLPADLVENFKKTGTSHIVALSGYNITMVGRFFVGLLAYLTLPFQISFWIASLGIFLFVVLTGASASVVRAGIMGVLVLIAQKEGRAYHMTNALVFAAAVMVFHNPQILRFDTAFQLSFLATCGLVYLSPQVERWLDALWSKLRSKLSSEQKKVANRGFLKTLKQTFIETASAQLAVLPLLIYSFGRVSVISPVTNILVLAAVPYAMVWGFIMGGAGFLFEPLSILISWFVWALLEYQIAVIELFAKVPGASLELGKWALIPLGLLYVYMFSKIWKSLKNI